MKEEYAYENLHQSKERLLKCLEEIKKYDCELGWDGSIGTFEEVIDVLIEAFPCAKDLLNI